MGFLAQKVEHQRTKLKVTGSSPAEATFTPTMRNAALFRQTRPGWVWLPWTQITIISENWSDCIATQIGQCNQYIIPVPFNVYIHKSDVFVFRFSVLKLA